MIYINSFLIGVLLADLIERRFSTDLIRNFIINSAFNIVYWYSKIQIELNKYIESNLTLSMIKTYINECNYKKVNMFEYIDETGEPTDGKMKSIFYIYSSPGADKKCSNKNIIHNFNKEVKEVILENSDVKFILTEISFEDKSFKVDLKTCEYNFYLIGNKFTRQFFMYYLKQYLNVKNINNDIIIRMKLIDHDVNMKEITFNNDNVSIILEKNSYKITHE
jgi:hypothetical protein